MFINQDLKSYLEAIELHTRHAPFADLMVRKGVEGMLPHNLADQNIELYGFAAFMLGGCEYALFEHGENPFAEEDLKEARTMIMLSALSLESYRRTFVEYKEPATEEEVLNIITSYCTHIYFYWYCIVTGEFTYRKTQTDKSYSGDEPMTVTSKKVVSISELRNK